MKHRLVPDKDRFSQALQKLRRISLKPLLKSETWRRFGHWIRWNTSLKRRRIKRLVRHLIPLDKAVRPEIQKLRDEVFMRTCLELKRTEHRRALLSLLNSANKPAGFEQIFLSAIYPQILSRNFGISLLPISADHRIDVEIGYLGHNDDYFFWVFEIDGGVKEKLDQMLVPEQRIRADKKYVIYRLGVAGLVEEQSLDALQWIINSQVLFNNLMADLKRRNYKVTAASISHFEQGRLSILRQLALEELKKHRSRS